MVLKRENVYTKKVTYLLVLFRKVLNGNPDNRNQNTAILPLQ